MIKCLSTSWCSCQHRIESAFTNFLCGWLCFLTMWMITIKILPTSFLRSLLRFPLRSSEPTSEAMFLFMKQKKIRNSIKMNILISITACLKGVLSKENWLSTYQSTSMMLRLLILKWRILTWLALICYCNIISTSESLRAKSTLKRLLLLLFCNHSIKSIYTQ